MEFYDFLSNSLPIVVIELCAAIAGTFYLKRVGGSKNIRFFVNFLWITVFVEILASYAPLAYFTDYQFLGFIKDKPIVRNYWIFNIYFLISYFAYTHFIKNELNKKSHRKFISILIGIFLVTSIFNLITSGVYFTAFSIYTNIAGTFVLLFTIAVYYFQLLRSDQITKISRLLPFYISIGAVVLHLCLTPFSIYSGFFKSSVSSEYVESYLIVLKITNLLVYSIYIIGFIVCQKKRSPY